MFLIRARRSLGLTAHRGWARLLVDRMDTQVQRPEFPQASEPAGGVIADMSFFLSPIKRGWLYPPPRTILGVGEWFGRSKSKFYGSCPIYICIDWMFCA